MSAPKGKITKQYTIHCGVCCGKYNQTTTRTRGQFVKFMRESNWKFLRKTGWTCNRCHKASLF